MISIEVNSIQNMQSSGNKKMGKGKNKKPRNQQENTKPTASDNDNKGKRKAKYPCLLCGGDHFMKECPRVGKGFGASELCSIAAAAQAYVVPRKGKSAR